MALERSAQGLENLRLFLDSDYVCLIEGKVEGDAPIDTVFWERIFSETSSKRISIQVRGSKQNVLDAFDKVRDRETSGLLFAIDLDHDDLKGQMIIDERVIYTYGYSWENDLLISGIDFEVLCGKKNSDQIQSEINSGLQHFARLIELDQIACGCNFSVVDRKNYGKYIDYNGHLPLTKRDMIAKDIVSARNKFKHSGAAPAFMAERDVSKRAYGHLVIKYVYHVYVRVVRYKIPFVAFLTILSNMFNISNSNTLKYYYEGQLSRAGAR